MSQWVETNEDPGPPDDDKDWHLQAPALNGSGPTSEQTTNGVHPEQISLVDRLEQKLLTSAELIAMPPPTYLIDGIIQDNSVNIIYGAPGSGKSFVTQSWAHHVGVGAWWFGRAVKQGPVLYIVAEGVEGVGIRTEAWQNHNNIHRADGVDWYPGPIRLLDATGDIAALVEVVRRRQYVLVVVDTLSRCLYGGDENSSKDMGVAVESLDQIRRASGAAVVACHHVTRAEGRIRGSSVLDGAVNTTIAARNTDGYLILTSDKPQKDGRPMEPIYLRIVPHLQSAVLTERGQPDHSASTATASLILAALEGVEVPGGVAASVWHKSTDVSERSFYRARKDLLTSGAVTNVGTDKTPRYLTTATAKALPTTANGSE